jgi:hypothetical protein
MKTTAYRLQQLVAERLGPGPGPEQFFIEEITPGIYAWYLESEGELISPLQAPMPWKAYAKKAVDLLKKPGTGASSVVWEPESGR